MKSFLSSVKGKVIVAVSGALVIAAAVIVMLVLNSNKDSYRNISISEVFGSVTAENSGKEYKAYKNMRLADGYALTTDRDSYTRMVMDDDKYVKMEEQSRVLFKSVGSDKSRRTTLDLERGALVTEITKPLAADEDYIVNTPNAVLAVRGTYFRVEVRFDENGDEYTYVYTYGGAVACRRILPDGTLVDEEVMINAGYKACIKMDEMITVYLEEETDGGEDADNVDPIELYMISDEDLVEIYNSSMNGHVLFLTSLELWNEIGQRGIDIKNYSSVYDGGDIPPYGGTEDHPAENNSGGESGNSQPTQSGAESSDTSEDSSGDSSESSSPADMSGGSQPQSPDNTHIPSEDNTPSDGNNSNGGTDSTDSTDSTDNSDSSDGNSESTAPPSYPPSSSTGSGSSGGSDSSDEEEEEEETGLLLYIDDGNIVITSTGYSQGGGAETPYTGNYIIAQQSGGTVNATITVASGTHTVTLKDVNITDADSVLAVQSGASVTLKGSGTSTVTSTAGIALYNEGMLDISSGVLNIRDDTVDDGSSTSMSAVIYNEGTMTISGTADVTADAPADYLGIALMGSLEVTGNASLSASAMAYGMMNMGGSFKISGGAVDIYGDSMGIYSMDTCEISGGKLTVNSPGMGLYIGGGPFTISGGSVEASGDGGDIVGDDIIVTGGSLRAVNDMIGAFVVNADGYELECTVYSTFPTAAQLRCENPDLSTYTYSLTAADKASDGKYYVWQPITYQDYNSDTIYLDNGDVTLINDALFTQDGVGYRWTVPHSPLIITQTASVVSSTVTVEGGTHNITLNSVNIRLTGESYVYPLSVESGASVTLTSVGTTSLYSSDDLAVDVTGALTISSGTFNIESGGSSAVSSSGRLVINGGIITASGGGVGISTHSDMEINGGDITAKGGMDITGSGALVSGGLYSTGSFKMTNGTLRAYDYSNVEVRNSPAGFHNNQGTFEMLGGTIIAESTNTANPSITTPSASNKEAYGFHNGGTFIMSGGNITATCTASIGYGGNSYGCAFIMSGGTLDFSGVTEGMLAGGTFELSGGKITATASGGYGLSYSGTDFKMTGGSFEISGTSFDIYGGYSGGTLVVMGGSLKAASIYTNISIVNEAGDTLICSTVSSYPGNIAAAGYTYYLDADDKASDGNYYVWLPSSYP